MSGPLSLTLSHGASNYRNYAELTNNRVTLSGNVSITMGSGSGQTASFDGFAITSASIRPRARRSC